MRTFKHQGAAWDSLFLAFVRIVTLASSMIQTKILSVGFTLADYGTYSQANVISSIVASLILLGLGDAINYFYNGKSVASNGVERLRFVNTIFAIELVAGVVVSSIFLLGQDMIIAYFSNEALRNLLIFVTLKPILENVLTLYQILFISVGRAKVIAFRNLIVSLGKLIIIYGAVYIFKSLTAIFVLLLILDIAQLLFFKFYIADVAFNVNPFMGSFKLVNPILTYALPVGAFALTSTLSRDIDKLVVSYIADTEQFAVYANCSRLLPFDIISASFATVLIPYVMKYVSTQEREKAILLFSNYLKVGYYSVWLLGVAVLIAAETIISFLYSSEYLSGKPVFIIYVIDSMIRFASMHLIITADGQTRKLMQYSLVSLAVNAIMNIVLFYLIGISGPAVATTIVSLCYTVAILRKSIRILNANWLDIFDLKDIGSFITQLGITGIIFSILNRGLRFWGVNQYFSMIISVGIFLVINIGILKTRITRIINTINELRL